nr:MAG: hypothetical protein [Barnaviridae sp.]
MHVCDFLVDVAVAVGAVFGRPTGKWVWEHFTCALGTWLDFPLGWLGWYGYGQVAPLAKRGNLELHSAGYRWFFTGREVLLCSGCHFVEGRTIFVALRDDRKRTLDKIGVGRRLFRFDYEFYKRFLEADGTHVLNLAVVIPRNSCFGTDVCDQCLLDGNAHLA